MNPIHTAFESALNELDRLRLSLRRANSKQIRDKHERLVLKATAMAWFKNHRSQVEQSLTPDDLRPLDEGYKTILVAGDRAASRSKCLANVRAVRRTLIEVRSKSLTMNVPSQLLPTTDSPPEFAKLVSSVPMQLILSRRWLECVHCIAANAPLAATVMMGGLLEGLLLAKVNSQSDKRPIFTSKTAPKDSKTGVTLPLSAWTLKDYIDVAHELKWITQSARDVGNVLRDYRNYVHPQKELSHGVVLAETDATLFWEISKSISRQLL